MLENQGAGSMFWTDPEMSTHKQYPIIRTVKQRDSRKKTWSFWELTLQAMPAGQKVWRLRVSLLETNAYKHARTQSHNSHTHIHTEGKHTHMNWMYLSSLYKRLWVIMYTHMHSNFLKSQNSILAQWIMKRTAKMQQLAQSIWTTHLRQTCSPRI